MIDNTRIVTDVLGHSKKIGSVQYIKSSSQNGTADISAVVQVFVMGRSLGIACKWEVKMRDIQSEAQAKYEQAVTTAGGKYFLVHNWKEFFSQYKSVLEEWKA
jgi:ATP:corrinoid adenosyltransferase